MTDAYNAAMEFIHDRSGYDRGFISNPFAGDEAARRGLIRTERVLDVLGRPDREYPILHVAGSKGKGSTSTILASILTASGLRAGRFLSPHLHRFNERFAIDGVPIDDPVLARCVETVREAALAVEAANPDIGQVTAWELSTVIALLWFREMECQAVVLEVGMGGTLDATNVIQPIASLITRLDFEHVAILGSTLAEIASNKAGIIKPEAPAFTVMQDHSALEVIRQRAAEVGTRLYIANEDWWVTGASQDFLWRGFQRTLDHLSVGLEGRHQVENAGLAIAALEVLSAADPAHWTVDEARLRTGLAAAQIDARFEVVVIDPQTTVVIDGAHTPASATVLAETIAGRFPDHHVTGVVGLLSDKDPKAVLTPLLPVIDHWVATAPHTPRALPVDEVAAALRKLGASITSTPSIADALTQALAETLELARPRLIVVTGSLTTAAEAREALGLAGQSFGSE
jgi:dihydrofolate synthase / folylpolyglutamate synthase